MKPDHKKDSVHYLKQGIELLENISDESFRNNSHEHFTSGVGKHFRHVIDHYTALLECLGGSKESINYDARRRNPRLEEDRDFAIETIHTTCREIEKLEYDRSGLRVEASPGTAETDQTVATESTLQREFQFLTSHTIHHYAIIALLLKLQGYHIPREFGVAPSTLRHEASR